jgi:hypothetical protein
VAIFWFISAGGEEPLLDLTWGGYGKTEGEIISVLKRFRKMETSCCSVSRPVGHAAGCHRSIADNFLPLVISGGLPGHPAPDWASFLHARIVC